MFYNILDKFQPMYKVMYEIVLKILSVPYDCSCLDGTLYEETALK